MADTKEFDVIRIARSDGSDTGPGYWPLTMTAATNATKKPPSKEAAEKIPRAKPQMVRLAEDDPRFVEWRIKLGILLKQEISPTPDEGNPWHVHFPRGYWLYEKSKHLWVSGYPIKAKLFKSPQEFGVHLLWLLSSSMEYADCCCVHCNAPNPAKAFTSEEPMTHAMIEGPANAVEKQAPKVTPVPLPPLPGQPVQRPASIVGRPPQPVQQAQTQSFQGTQHLQTPQTNQSKLSKSPASISTAPIATTAPQPIPQPLTAQAQTQQQIKPQPPGWSLKAPHTFRAGELVWYQTGNTWRLGVVASPGAGPYELIPLGHGMIHQQNVSKPETDLRPFHCYSVPSVDVADLKDRTFDDVSWEAVFQSTGNDAIRRDQINLDASKMAASKIDSSYSLWTRRSEDVNTKTVTYYGCFFGAERIEVGDCVRVKGGDLSANHTVIMGLCHIFTTGDYAGQFFLRGHIYHLSQGPPSTGTVVPEEKLPVALRDEIQWRKSVAPNQQWCAVLIRENVVLKEQAVRGRFYSTHRLLPLYNPAEHRSILPGAQLRDQHVYLNNRMDAGGQYIGRKKNRREVLGASVPQTAGLSFEPHVIEEV